MADQQLNIKLNVIDNATKAFTEVKNSIFNVRNALIGLGAGVAVNSLVNVGKKAEEAKLRLSNLTGSTEAGARAFDQFTQFAISAKIPLDDVISSSKKLIALGSSPEKLAKNLQQVSNISATLGLDFETSVEQFSKATTKGLSNARIFAESNLKQILGIPRGLELSAQETARILEKDFGSGGRFGKAGENLRNSLSGNIIAIQNVFSKFASDVGTKFFDVLRNQVGDLGQFFKSNQEPIKKFAELIGTGLANLITVTANSLKFLKDNIELVIGVLIGTAIIKAIDTVRQLSLALLGIATIFKTNPVYYTIALTITGIATAFSLLSKNASEAEQVLRNIEKTAVRNKKVFDSVTYGNEVSEGLDNANQGLSEQSIRLKEIKALEEGLRITRSKPFEAEDYAPDRLASDFTALDEILIKIGDKNTLMLDQLLNIGATVSDTLNKGISDFAQGIAESIVLGKSLGDTFKNIGQNLLVAILKNSIEIIARKTLELAIEKMITKEKIAQASITSTGGGGFGGGLFGTIARIGFNAFAGGGSVPLDAPNFYNPDFGYAEGGAVRGGMPITVGERGRELFVPSTNGTIIPNHDLNNGMNITFNIQANDVRGIKELLIDNRATIINLVNQGANQKGKSNVV
jgi:hypothetical protein